MKSLNKCCFIGRLGRDLEQRMTQDGKAVVNGTMAVNGYKDSVEWVRFCAFDKFAEIMAKYLTKGSMIYLSGRMQTRKYTKDNQDHYSTEIVADEVQFLGGKQDRQEQPRERWQEPTGEPIENEIPF